MVDKKIIIGVSAGALAALVALSCVSCHMIKSKTKAAVTAQSQQTAVTQPRYVSFGQPKPAVEKQAEHADLYSSTPYDIPLISIAEICKLSPKVKKSVDDMLESSQGFYFLKQDPDTKDVTILLQNSVDLGDRYSRHNLQFAQISPDGNISYHFAGYDGEDGETSNAVVQGDDIWEFDKSVEPPRPLKHTAYDNKGKAIFTEEWDYSPESEIRYIMKNAEGKTLSILKETLDGDVNYRKEHIFYDKDGNTTMSVSANFEGPNLKRFTYYDSETPKDNVTIESEYSEDGNKTGEKIYNQEYKLTKTVKADYTDGERKEIRVMDSEGKELKALKD